MDLLSFQFVLRGKCGKCGMETSEVVIAEAKDPHLTKLTFGICHI